MPNNMPTAVKNPVKPCKDCPFMDTTAPGKLGGSSPEVYMGQVYGPFLLPCHKHCDFDDPNWKDDVLSIPQCAGAAMFRKKNGVSDRVPALVHSLPPIDGLLDTPTAFYMHHKQISEAEANVQLAILPPERLLAMQVSSQSAKHYDPATKARIR